MKVLTAGVVLTQDGLGTVAEAIAWQGRQIVAVGSAADVLERAGTGAEVIELGGAAVVPGFIDAHQHFGMAALYRGALDCGPGAAPSIAELLRLITLAAGEPVDGEWLIGSGFDERLVLDRRRPTLAELDGACPSRPLVIMHYSFHGALVNSRALASLRIDEASLDRPAGRIGRDRRGRLTGWLTETAMSSAAVAAEAALFSRDPEGLAREMAAQAERLLEVGITRVADATVAPWLESFYRQLHEAGRLRLPLVMLPVGERGYLSPPLDRLEGPITGVGPETLRVGPLKLFADGGDEMAIRLPLGELGPAALRLLAGALRGNLRPLGQLDRFRLRPGADLALHGGMRFLKGEAIFALAREAVERGFSLAIHAMGNEAVADALDLLASVRARHRDVPPPRIEHAFLVGDEQLRRAEGLGVQLVCQPAFLSLTDGLASPLPSATILPLRRARDLGLRVAASSDHPVVTFDPLVAMRAAVSRVGAPGEPPVHPEEALSAEEVIEAYTREAAWACGCSDVCGSLEPGKRADLVVLSADPRGLTGARLDGLRVIETILAGERVFRRRS